MEEILSMSFSRFQVEAIISLLAEEFATHSLKLLVFPKSRARNTWTKEIGKWYDACRLVGMNQKSKPLTAYMFYKFLHGSAFISDRDVVSYYYQVIDDNDKWKDAVREFSNSEIVRVVDDLYKIICSNLANGVIWWEFRPKFEKLVK